MSITGKITNLFADKAMTIPAFPRTKIKAVSDDNGVGLDAILNGMVHAEEYSSDVATVPLNADTFGGYLPSAFALNARADDLQAQINSVTAEQAGATTIVKLWENASPASNFPAQTVSVDLTGYSFIFVEGISQPASANNLYLMSSKVPVAVGNAGVLFETYSDHWAQVRPYSITSTGVRFELCAMQDHSGHTYYTDWDSRAIPTAIYGIKGVK